jgi:hypothetical protein
VRKGVPRSGNYDILLSIICTFLSYFFALYLTRDRYRYGTMIVFANYLIERREPGEGPETTFPEWLDEHREITKLLGRRSLD